MLRLTGPYSQLALAALLLLAGIIVLITAWVQATDIPPRAHDDFGALIVRQGGSMSHPPEYSSVYRRMSADSRMLRNAYLGGSGLILLAAGSFGLMLAARPRPPLADWAHGETASTEHPVGDRPAPAPSVGDRRA